MMQDRPLTAAAAPAADVAGTRGSEARIHGSHLAVERRSVAAMAQVTTRGNPGKELNSLWLEEVGEG
jgi:hypothetical protein